MQDRTDSWLFKKEYQEQEVLGELAKKLNNVVALDEALEILMQTIIKTLHFWTKRPLTSLGRIKYKVSSSSILEALVVGTLRIC